MHHVLRFLALPLALTLSASPAAAQVVTRGAGASLDAAVAAPHFGLATTVPARNVTAAPRTTAIRLRFTQALDPATVTPRSVHVFGRWSGVANGTTSFAAGGTELVFQPTNPFSAGEQVTVFVSRAVRDAQGHGLGRGYSFQFWVDSRASSSTFTQAAVLTPGFTPYGAYGGDLDHDGDLDLSIPNEDSSDVSVFLNDGSGSFGPAVAYPVGFHCSSNEGADFDHDGHTDLVVANILDDDMSVLIGRGDGTFEPQVRHATGNGPRGVTVLDADGDGWIDIATANRSTGDVSTFANRRDGTFDPEVRIQAGVSNETGLTAVDMNDDDLLDLVVIGYGSNSARILLGDGRGGFHLGGVFPVGPNPWMVVAGDVNGDGHNDIAAALSSGSAASICLGDGSGGLLAPTFYAAGTFPIALDLGDLNGDGLLDLTISAFGSGDFSLWFNQGNGTMGAPQTLGATQAASCTVLHDFDGDGDVDITAIDELSHEVFLFRQDG